MNIKILFHETSKEKNEEVFIKSKIHTAKIGELNPDIKDRNVIVKI